MNKDKVSISESISKLIDLTRNGTIKWSRASSWMEEPGMEIENIFNTIYNDRKIRIIEYKIKKTDYWERDVSLKLISKDGNIEWEFPANIKLSDLLDTIKYQQTDVEEFLKSLF